MRIAIIVNCNSEKFFAKEKVPRMKERERESKLKAKNQVYYHRSKINSGNYRRSE